MYSDSATSLLLQFYLALRCIAVRADLVIGSFEYMMWQQVTWLCEQGRDRVLPTSLRLADSFAQVLNIIVILQLVTDDFTGAQLG